MKSAATSSATRARFLGSVAQSIPTTRGIGGNVGEAAQAARSWRKSGMPTHYLAIFLGSSGRGGGDVRRLHSHHRSWLHSTCGAPASISAAPRAPISLKCAKTKEYSRRGAANIQRSLRAF
jgi:hypothetical protein